MLFGELRNLRRKGRNVGAEARDEQHWVTAAGGHDIE
jgi:hypothetical protein